eukprot:UN07874
MKFPNISAKIVHLFVSSSIKNCIPKTELVYSPLLQLFIFHKNNGNLESPKRYRKTKS